MDGISMFEEVFGSRPDIAYSQRSVDDITKHRRQLGKELFFDKLLKAVGITELYPPKSHDDLYALFTSIVESAAPDHHKQSLTYYLLKDLGLRNASATAFAQRCYLSGKYQTLVDGLWFIDRLDFERALDHLTDPSLIPTFSEEILQTLCRHSKNQPSLPLAYYHTVAPSIKSTQTLEMLFLMICRSSISEAYLFTRTQEPLSREYLFEHLISFVLGDAAGSVRSSRATELIGLPFNEDEERWFERYLTVGNGSKLYGAKDTLLMRRLATGRPEGTSKLVRQTRDRSIDGMSWSMLTECMDQAN